MERPNFEVIVDDKKNKRETYILIVDKKGSLGSALCKKLIESCFVVFASHVFPKELSSSQNLSFISYRNNIPEIPQGWYSHIFIVYNGEKEIKESVPNFLTHAKKTNAKLIFITPLLGIKKVKSWDLELYKNTKFIFYGDLFGQPVGQNIEESETNELLFLAKNKGRIVIEGVGLKKMHPVLFEDAITGILETAFGNNEESNLLLFPEYPPTQLSVAKMLHKIDPSLKIDFIRSNEEELDKESYKAAQGKYLLEKDYPLFEKLKNAYDSFNVKNLNEEGKHRKQNFTVEKYFQSAIFLLTFLLLLFFIPFLITSFFSFLGLNYLKSAKTQIENGNFNKAGKNAKMAENFFSLSSFTIKLTEKELSLIGKEKNITSFAENIKIGKEASEALIYGFDAWSNFSKVFNGESKDAKNDFNTGLNSLQKMISFYQKTKAENNLIFSKSLFFTKDFNTGVSFIITIKDLLPAILGFDGEKKYLVLFQNNMELRAGGGFIGSYGILTFKNGKKQDFKIHDVYDADGELKGHIEPPFPIRRYVPQVHLFLRDSNFNIDFLKGASVSAQILSKETEEVADGVIAIDVIFVKNLIGVLGKIYVSDYKETVDKDNFYLLTQTYSEKDFFPGSAQKKNFLNSLFNAILQNTETGENISYASLLSLIGKSISEKHILFAFSDPKIQEAFTVNGFSSAVLDKRQNRKPQINDFLGINEMNLGVNKANYYIKRKIVQNVSIENDGSVSERLTVIYKNESRPNVWPGGDYKNYVRFILPKGTDLKSVAIDGKEQKITEAITDPTIYEKKNFKPPLGLEVEVYEQDGKTIYGFLFIAPSEKFTTVSIFYNLKKKISFDSASIYDIKVFKQPGTDNDSYDLILDYPPGLNFLKLEDDSGIDGQLKSSKDRIEYKTKLLKDINLKFNFTRK